MKKAGFMVAVGLLALALLEPQLDRVDSGLGLKRFSFIPDIYLDYT